MHRISILFMVVVSCLPFQTVRAQEQGETTSGSARIRQIADAFASLNVHSAFAVRSDVAKELGLPDGVLELLAHAASKIPTRTAILNELGLDLNSMMQMKPHEFSRSVQAISAKSAEISQLDRRFVAVELTEEQRERLNQLRLQFVCLHHAQPVAGLKSLNSGATSERIKKNLQAEIRKAEAELSKRMLLVRRNLFRNAIMKSLGAAATEDIFGTDFLFESEVEIAP